MIKTVNHIESIPGAPNPVAHYCVAAEVSNPSSWLFPSGILPIGENGLPKGIKAQAEQVLKNLNTILEHSGFDLKDIVKVNVMLKSMDDFKAFGAVYEKFMGTICPARAAYGQAEIALNALVEIEVIAAR
jgi:2-iminobutanoate/2-iminopropanoate deaminase